MASFTASRVRYIAMTRTVLHNIRVSYHQIGHPRFWEWNVTAQHSNVDSVSQTVFEVIATNKGSGQHMKRGWYLETFKNCRNRELPYTTPSACQLNHMLPTLTDQLELIREPNSSQMGQVSWFGLANTFGSALAVRQGGLQLRDLYVDTTVQGREEGMC